MMPRGEHEHGGGGDGRPCGFINFCAISKIDTSTAMAGTVASAVWFLAKALLTGNFSGIPE
jgi:hypothetical protein